ncbi:MAG: isoprenylcysteine carboxylmethyltransferase family protein [Leptospirales bacterium]|nr:isoprenylcysteine carboxylmethyltransferase family protein [Leptospirales bacterium]
MKAFTLRFGNFIFRWRDTIFTLIVLGGIVAVALDPAGGIGDRQAEFMFTLLGAVVFVLGEFVRCITIGYAYIKRGGLKKEIFAERLVVRGLFAHTRNPMYLGNILIALGAILTINYLWFYIFVLPLFLYIYLAITYSEENYLRGKFGPEYDQYCRDVNRFLPGRLSGFKKSIEGMTFTFRRLLKKEHGTITALGVMVALLNLVKFHARYAVGWDSDFALNVYTIIAALLIFELITYILASTGKLEWDPDRP